MVIDSADSLMNNGNDFKSSVFEQISALEFVMIKKGRSP